MVTAVCPVGALAVCVCMVGGACYENCGTELLDQAVAVDGEAYLCMCMDFCSVDSTWMLAL